MLTFSDELLSIRCLLIVLDGHKSHCQKINIEYLFPGCFFLLTFFLPETVLSDPFNLRSKRAHNFSMCSRIADTEPITISRNAWATNDESLAIG